MTYDQDPARWSTDPDEAPELLRGAFSAGRNEGPSRNQMRSLAVKLAAASAGGAVAVGTVKAASAGNTLATAATWSAAKVASVVVLAGSVVTGAMIWRNSSPDAPHERVAAPARAPATAPAQIDDSVETTQAAAPVVQPVGSSAAPSSAAQPTAPAMVVTQGGVPVGAAPGVTVEAVRPSPQPRAAQQSTTTGSVSAPAVRASTEKPAARSSSPEQTSSVRTGAAQRKTGGATATTSARSARVTSASSAELPPPSEVSLLRNAQVALQSRPREAFQLTQQHRRLYPAGEFAQERDALAIQALMRAGETEQARELAQAFIRAHPTSPHAHRFREAMGIR
ncbi:MAG TPA: hypothetical protein VFZ61_23830 [Polyangiales bacterium]